MAKVVAIYIRVSTLDQAREGYSLAAQQKALEAWALSQGYTVYRVYIDAGISGKDIAHRPEMTRMIADAQAERFDLILIWALSRLTRSVADLYTTWELLSRHNVDIKSYTEPFDTSTVIGRATPSATSVACSRKTDMGVSDYADGQPKPEMAVDAEQSPEQRPDP